MGNPIPTKDRIKYLGSILSQDGRMGTELNHRLGAARSEFDKLRKVWNHTSITRARKYEIFTACVITKLLYCLNTTWLNKAELCKLDAFQARCLRQLAGIKPSFISHVTNEYVRSLFDATLLSRSLLEQQLLYFGHIASKPTGDVMRDSIFTANSFSLHEFTGKRRRGRPRDTWSVKLHKIAIDVAGSLASLENMLASSPVAKAAWRRQVARYCRS